MLKTFTNMTIAIIWVGQGRSKGSYHEPIVPGLLVEKMLGTKTNPTIFSPNGGEQWWWINPMGSKQSAPKIHQLNKIPEHGTLLMSINVFIPSSKSWISPPKFNSESPWKKWCLEDYCMSFWGPVYFQGGELLNFQGVSLLWSPWLSCWNCG